MKNEIKKNEEAKREEIKKNGAAKKNGITELVFLLDRSGSMAGLESDTIGGFNGMIEKQKKQDGVCWVSTILFANESRVIHDRVSLEKVRPMTEDDYTVGGCTALIDAIGDAIRHVGSIHKYARAEDVPEHTVFVITTDGLENASRKYSADEVRRMIEQRKEENGWEFLFIGANIDAVQTARSYGIAPDRAVNYHADKRGTEVVFSCVSEAVAGVRARAPMQANWSQSIREDYESRGGADSEPAKPGKDAGKTVGSGRTQSRVKKGLFRRQK